MEPKQPNIISRAGKPEGQGAPQGQGQGGAPKPNNLIERFNALPTMGKVAVGVGGVLALMLLFGGGNGGNGGGTPQQANLGQVGTGTPSPSAAFTALESDRPALIQNVFEQNRRELASLQGRIEQEFADRDAALQDALAQNQQLQQQMQQMMTDFTAEIQNMQAMREQDAARLAQLADQQRQRELGLAVGDASLPGPLPGRRQPIKDVPLGPPPQGFEGMGRSLLGQFNQLTAGGAAAVELRGGQESQPVRPPFIPPLGFVEATLLNGVDALVGGETTPALARIHGSYLTAMNTTVHLDGCIVLIEFNGNIATERAIGKPARMTCVYPDGGAATYDLAGYVVDSNDGVIGVPGLLYEGDPTRIAASMMADFLAGVGEVIRENQTTSTVSDEGTRTNTVTGDELRAELAGGVDKAFSSIREYLRERVDRTTPFIRLDALRRVNLVLLDGTELRPAGNAWTLLFDGEAADQNRRNQQPAQNPALVVPTR